MHKGHPYFQRIKNVIKTILYTKQQATFLPKPNYCITFPLLVLSFDDRIIKEGIMRYARRTDAYPRRCWSITKSQINK